MSRETELKLSYSPEGLEALRRSHVLRRVTHGTARKHRLVSTYFDTEDRLLAAQGISLRVRREGRRNVLCVKAPESSIAGLAIRREWEIDIHSDEPDLSAFPHGTVDTVLNVPWLADRLVRVFRTDFVRVERDGLLDGGGGVRIAIDEGEILAGDVGETISEVEIELVEGTATALFDLALTLHRAVPARVGTRAKSERGHALAEKRGPAPRLADDVDLAEVTGTGVAFTRIAAACLAHWLGNVDVVAADRDPEGIHQMRVALRRLRSAFRIFRDLARTPEAEGLVAEIRWLASALGPARDWDVFAESALGPVAEGLADAESLEPLGLAVARARNSAHSDAISAVMSTRHTDLVLGLGRWLSAAQWGDGGTAIAAEPVALFAARCLDRHWRRVRKAGRRLTRLTAPQLHELRIEIKKLRYAAEFFASLHDERAVRRFLSGLKGMQDFLGHLNDLDVARHLMASIPGGGIEMARAEGLVLGWHAAGIARDRKHLAELWSRVLALDPYWT